MAGFGQVNNTFYNMGTSNPLSAFDSWTVKLDDRFRTVELRHETDVWSVCTLPGLWGETQCMMFAANGECASTTLAPRCRMVSANASFQPGSTLDARARHTSAFSPKRMGRHVRKASLASPC